MQPKSALKLQRRRDALLSQLPALGPVMRGSVVRLGTRCGHPRCRCARGEKHQQTYFSLNKEGKTVLLFLGKSREAEARQYVENYHLLMAWVEEMTAVMMEGVKHKAFR
jgi:DNA-binding sugar fermentation-stimulating protein